MKRTLLFIIVTALLFVLGACTKELSKADVVSEMNDHADEVENYHTKIGLEVEIVNVEEDVTEQKSTSEMEVDVIEPTIESGGKIISKQGEMTSVTEYYSTEEATYANIDKTGWEDYSDTKEQFKTDETFYNNVQEIVDTIEEDVDMELKDDQYILTFKGASQDVFDAFKAPYTLEVTGVNEDEVDQDVVIKINKDTFYVEHVENVITGENQGHKLILSVKHDYTNFNDVDSIEIPEKVLNEFN